MLIRVFSTSYHHLRSQILRWEILYLVLFKLEDSELASISKPINWCCFLNWQWNVSCTCGHTRRKLQNSVYVLLMELKWHGYVLVYFPILKRLGPSSPYITVSSFHRQWLSLSHHLVRFWHVFLFSWFFLHCWISTNWSFL